MRAEDVLLSGTTNSRGSQEQPSTTGVATHGENTHRDSSGNTENASSVMRGRMGGVITDRRRINDELKDLFRSPERAMRVVERSAAANITDATQEALRRVVEHISGSQEQPSITGGVATHGENMHRDSSGNTENASRVMRGKSGVVITDTRRITDELKDLFRSPERAMRVMERSCLLYTSDAADE